jgi:hypothetical protein
MRRGSATGRPSRDAGGFDLPDVVDAVADHREPLEAAPDADGRVDGGIGAEVPDDAVGEDAPGEDFEPAPVLFDLQLPGRCVCRTSRP